MKTIWDLLKYMKRSKPVRIHNAKVIIRETLRGEESELTDLGISEYFRIRGNVKFELNGVVHKSGACYVTLKVKDKYFNREVVGCGLEYEKEQGDDNVFSRAVSKAVINGMRTLITPEIEHKLIKQYIEHGKAVRIPLETEKIKIFRPGVNACLANRAG